MLDATELLLARYGYSKMTMEDVAREAGLGRRTIYLHFSSKEEIALCSIDRIVERLLTCLDEIASSEAPVERRVRDMLITRVMFRFDSVRDYYQSFHDMFATLRPAYLARREGYFKAESERIAEVIRQGQVMGVFGMEDSAVQSRLMLTATNALLPYSLSPRELGERDHVEKMVIGIADLLLDGVRKR